MERDLDVAWKQLLPAIVEVSQAAAKVSCEAKEDVMEKVKALFTCYNSVAIALANDKPKIERRSLEKNTNEEQTHGKEVSASQAGSSPDVETLQKTIQNIDEKYNILERKLNSFMEKFADEAKGRSEQTDNMATTSPIGIDRDFISNKIIQIDNNSNGLEAIKTRLERINRVVESQSEFGTTLVGIQDELLKLHQGNADLERLVTMSEKKGLKKRPAFSARALISERRYTALDVIQFKEVQLNIEECFDPEGSVFKSKSSGVYFFSASISTNSRGHFLAAIVHDDDEVGLFGTPVGTTDVQLSTSVLLTLNPGDKVCVRVATQAIIPDAIFGGTEIGGGFSNFIGFKIF